MLIGRLYFARDEYDEAFHHFGMAKKLKPSYGNDYNLYLAVYLFNKKRYDKTLEVLDGIRHPLKDSICDIQYMYSKSYMMTGDDNNAGVSSKRKDACTVRLGLFRI